MSKSSASRPTTNKVPVTGIRRPGTRKTAENGTKIK